MPKTRFNSPHHIDDEAAYENAIRRNIRANATKGNLKRWRAESDDHQELYDWLANTGEFKETWCGSTMRAHPLTRNMFSGDFGTFLMKLAQSLTGRYAEELDGEKVEHWGKISEKQTKVVRDSLARAKKWAAEREEKWAQEAASLEYIGTVGDKHFEVHGTIAYISRFDNSVWGDGFVTTITATDGNQIVYKGKRLGEKGDTLTMVATIKAHEEFRGKKQTVVNRPRKINIINSEEGTDK